jgi:signal peptidase II
MNRILILIILIFLDIFSKQFIFKTVSLNSFIFVNNFFDIVHIHNFGISFGMFSSLNSPWIFIVIGSFITGVIVIMYLQSKNNIEKWGLLVIISGALSNIIDRAMNGYVIDFLYLHYKDFYWPAFNFADIYISIGIFIILLQLIFNLKKNTIK